jgi:hypothetical protein
MTVSSWFKSASWYLYPSTVNSGGAFKKSSKVVTQIILKLLRIPYLRFACSSPQSPLILQPYWKCGGISPSVCLFALCLYCSSPHAIPSDTSTVLEAWGRFTCRLLFPLNWLPLSISFGITIATNLVILVEDMTPAPVKGCVATNVVEV